METKIIIVRHGITKSNMYGFFVGRTDVPLSFIGRKQSKIVGKWLNSHEKVDAIYSSALMRAKSTAEIISEYNKAPMFISKNLNEMDFGDWEGKRYDEIIRKYPEKYVTWENMPHLHTIPQAENLSKVNERVILELNNIIKKMKGKTLCIVSHSVCIRLLMAHFKGLDLVDLNCVPLLENAAISLIHYSNGKFIIRKENFTNHLGDDLKEMDFVDISKMLSLEWKYKTFY